jgi:hypothetical protein
MEGLLNFILALQLTIGPLALAYELEAVPNSAEGAVVVVYLPTLMAYTRIRPLEESIDEIMDDYRSLAHGWTERESESFQ